MSNSVFRIPGSLASGLPNRQAVVCEFINPYPFLNFEVPGACWRFIADRSGTATNCATAICPGKEGRGPSLCFASMCLDAASGKMEDCGQAEQEDREGQGFERTARANCRAEPLCLLPLPYT